MISIESTMTVRSIETDPKNCISALYFIRSILLGIDSSVHGVITSHSDPVQEVA
jgi:hypothetical protein